jgi:hypothetical protein
VPDARRLLWRRTTLLLMVRGSQFEAHVFDSRWSMGTKRLLQYYSHGIVLVPCRFRSKRGALQYALRSQLPFCVRGAAAIIVVGPNPVVELK